MTTIEVVDKKKRKIIIDKDDRYGVCGATKRDGGICTLTSGQGTDHPNEGRCYWHEDMSNGSPVRKYQIAALEDRMEFFLRDREVYSLDREIALLRSYLELHDKLIAVFKDTDFETQKEMGINFDSGELTRSLTLIVRTIAKLIQTKHEIEVGRKYVIDIRVVHGIMNTVGEILDKCILDPDIREQINHGLNRISLPVASI